MSELTFEQMQLPVAERRAALRQHYLDRATVEARCRAGEFGLTLNCRIRMAQFGVDHKPCKAPPDDIKGVNCLCECHDAALAAYAR